METKKIVALGVIGVGAFALMSFGKKPKITDAVIEDETQSPITQPPVYVPVKPPVVIQDPISTYQPPVVVVNPPVNTDPVVVEIEPVRPPTTYVEPTQFLYPLPEKKLEISIIKLVSKTIGYNTSVTLDIKFTNNTDKAINLKDIHWLKLQRNDDNAKFLGNSQVSFNDIKLLPKMFIILKNIKLSDLIMDSTTYYHVNFREIVTLIPYLSTTKPDTKMVTELYSLKDRNIVATAVEKVAARFVGNRYELEINMKIYNSTNSIFNISEIIAIDLFYKSGPWIYLSTTPIYFANIKIPQYSEVTLNNIVLIVPNDFYGELATRISQRDLSSNLKLELS